MSDENLPQVVSVDRDRVAKALGGFIPKESPPFRAGENVKFATNQNQTTPP